MTKSEIKKTVESYIEKGYFYPVDDNGEYAGGCWVDRLISESGSERNLAVIAGIPAEEYDSGYAKGNPVIGLIANENRDPKTAIIYIEYYSDENGEAPEYTIDEFAEKYGE